MSVLVIVESPTKARTIEGLLPPDHTVLASMGHVRDLPSSASEIPKSARDKPWSRLGVDVDSGFEPLYVIPRQRRSTIKELREALSDADALIIATDEDREGESIGWHVVEVLKPGVPVKRMVFHEITESAIEEALAHTRTIDLDLVRAQEARRILDRLVGYTLSPLLWQKIAPRLSAGRVQSVAVRFLVERERERRAFVVGSYWDLLASLAKRPSKGAPPFEATLTHVKGQRIATGKDFDEATGRIAEGKDVLLLSESEACGLRDRLQSAEWAVSDVRTKSTVRRPYPPFTTSTLQQEAGRKLGLTARRTMRLAQELYESGLITYHRTDSFTIANEAIGGIRQRVQSMYGEDYLCPKPRRFRTKSGSAQEAHEAIRPAGTSMSPVRELGLSGKKGQVYDLIWKRTMATQMADAKLELVTVDIAAAEASFRANGRRVVFPGFFRVYVEGSDDPDAVIEDRDSPLPELTVGDVLELKSLEPQGHETKPPARFTEASLVKALENAGVGRPSTYASIISTIQDRGYCFKRGRALVPTYVAFAVTRLLESDFDRLVDEGFTAAMESDLDGIARGEVDWRHYLARLYSGDDGLAAQVAEAKQRIDPRQASTVDLGDVAVRIGRYGPYLETQVDGERLMASVPEDLPPADLTAEEAAELLRLSSQGPQSLGLDPESGKEVLLKSGPYGPYVQLGGDDQVDESATGDGDPGRADKSAAAGSDGGDKKTKGKRKGKRKPKPKRSSLPPNVSPEEVDLQMGLALLALPRELGTHPETGKPVKAGLGRYGPYVVHEKTFASLQKKDDVLTVELPRALELLKAKAERAKKRASGGKRKPRGRKKK